MLGISSPKVKPGDTDFDIYVKRIDKLIERAKLIAKGFPSFEATAFVEDIPLACLAKLTTHYGLEEPLPTEQVGEYFRLNLSIEVGNCGNRIELFSKILKKR